MLWNIRELTQQGDWRGWPASEPPGGGTLPPPGPTSPPPPPSCSASRWPPAMITARERPLVGADSLTSPKQYKTFCLLNPSALPAQKHVPWQTTNILRPERPERPDRLVKLVRLVRLVRWPPHYWLLSLLTDLSSLSSRPGRLITTGQSSHLPDILMSS